MKNTYLYIFKIENLWVAAFLIGSPKIIVIPTKFIYKLSVSKTFNYRVNRNQPHLIFWSEDHQDEPNFQLPIAATFNHDHKACYRAYLLKAFGKKISNGRY